jgi:hypothetical protein
VTRSAPLPAKRELIEPTFWTCPHGVRVRPEPSLTYGPEVADLCDKAGYTPDPQQELGLDLVFAFRSDGSPASFAFCVICARQNLKSGLFQQCVIGWLFITDVPEIAWSAHELRTSMYAQVELYRTLESPALSRYLIPTGNKGLYDANGKERIELNTGQKVWFQTRTRDGGRGLGKPKVIIDEAFKFKARVAGALLPILLAQHWPQLLYGSSEPPIDDPDAAQLRDVMDRGQGHKSPELSYLHWRGKKEPCADPDCRHPKDALVRGLDCALDREHLILEANPTIDRDDAGHALDTGRITIGTVRNLRQELPIPEYMRECMSWPEDAGEGLGPPAINARTWNDLAIPSAQAPTRAAVVIDVEPDQSATTIALVGGGPAGRALGLVDVHEDEADAIGALLALKENLDLLEVAFHPSTQAGTLAPALKAAGIEFKELVHKDVARGCSAIRTAVKRATFAHVGQLELDSAATSGRTRKVAELELWDRANAVVPLGPLVAVGTALQRYLELTAKPKPPPPPPARSSSRSTRQPREFSAATAGF